MWSKNGNKIFWLGSMKEALKQAVIATGKSGI